MRPEFKWFLNLKTMWKLMIGFGIVLMLTAVISFRAISDLGRINERAAVMYDRDLLGLSEIKEAANSQLKCARLMRNAIIAAGDGDAVQLISLQLQQEFSRLNEHLTRAEARFVRPEGRALITKARAQVSDYQKVCKGIVEIARAGNLSAARAELKNSAGIANGIIATFDESSRQKEVVAEQTRAETQELYSSARSSLSALALGAVAVGLMIGFVIARSVSSPLTDAVKVLESISRGDLTQRLTVDTEDEVGLLARKLNSALESIGATLQDVQHTALALTGTAADLSRRTVDLASGSRESAAALEETSASLEQMTATVRQNSESTKHVSQLTSTAKETAVQGEDIVESVINAMDEIHKSSHRISEITMSIDEIAFQTNLLAVNAEIEAALAGEQGRGFSIVAQEVRALSKRCAVAAKEIKKLVSDSVKKAGDGSILVNDSGNALKDVASCVKKVADVVVEISSSTSEQTVGLDQINSALSQMNAVAQVSSENTEQISSSAKQVAQEAAHLKQLLTAFVLPAA